MYSNVIWNSAARVAEREKAEIFLREIQVFPQDFSQT